MRSDFEEFYHRRIADFGVTAQGVGWKNKEAQQVRFLQLVKIIRRGDPFSINDLGCGTGDLIPFLDSNDFKFDYQGYDVMEEMVRAARLRFSDRVNVGFTRIVETRELKQSDYTVASGIFNIRFRASNEDWLKYILETITVMNERSRKGFSFNMLTMYSDRDYMKEELYYGDPCLFFEHCKRNFSKNVALLHDYDQYDFTILVRKE